MLYACISVPALHKKTLFFNRLGHILPLEAPDRSHHETRGNLTMTEKVLVIHQGALGDVLLTFPALTLLREQKDVSLALMCKDQIGRMASALKVVDIHLPIESARFAPLFSEDMNHDMERFINFYETVLYVGFSHDVEHHIRQRHRGHTWKITPRPCPEEETHVAIHIVKEVLSAGLWNMDKNVAGDESLLCKWQLQRLPHDMQESQRGRLERRGKEGVLPSGRSPGSVRKPNQKGALYLIHPGAGSLRKRWPVENFVEVASGIQDMRSGEVCFLIGPAECDLPPRLKEQAGKRFEIHGVGDLAEVMAFMHRATRFIGNDSGLTHLAAMMGLPTVAIFGPSSPQRWSPIGGTTRVLRGKPDCVPCFETADQNCADPRCFESVSVNMVLDAIHALT